MVNKIILGDLLFPYQPRQKCGTGALLFMSGVSALTGLGASMYATTEAKEQNADMQNLALNYNEHVRNDEHRIENEHYWERLNDMRSWYADRFNTEQQAVFDNWLRQNDPNTLLPKYAEAGYNMSAMQGASNMAMSPASTPVVTSQSSPMQSPASIPAAMTPMSNQAQMLTSIGGLIKDLASSSKDSAEVGELLSMLGPKVKNMLLQNDALSLTNEWTKARNQFKDKWWDQEFKNKIAEGNDLYWDAYFKAAQGELTDEKIFTEYLDQEDKYWDIQFDKAKTDEQQERVRQARIETQFWRQRMQSQIRLMNSQANSNNASARLSGVQADIADIDKIIHENDADVSLFTLGQKIASVSASLEYGAISDKAKTEAAKAELMKLKKITEMYQNNPSKLRVDATLKNFNENFPVLSQLMHLAK